MGESSDSLHHIANVAEGVSTLLLRGGAPIRGYLASPALSYPFDKDS